MFIIFIQATLFNLITFISKPLLKASSAFFRTSAVILALRYIPHNYYKFQQVPP